MGLETERGTRDYLYGRLLAYADHIEEKALWLSGEQRETTAVRLLQRFSNRPFSTWRTIETSLRPYQARLRGRWPGYYAIILEQMDQVFTTFEPIHFTDDSKLSGEFLLGYHCQRQELKKDRKAKPETEIDTLQETNI